MIADKRMKFVKCEEGINYYLFQPSLFSFYYDDKKCKHEKEPSHRYSITHKLHMLLYLLKISGGVTKFFTLRKMEKYYRTSFLSKRMNALSVDAKKMITTPFFCGRILNTEARVWLR